MPDEQDAHRGPLDAVLDLMFFGPIGLLANCRQVVPELAAKGREVVDQQVNIARFVGRFTVQRGQQQAGRAVQHVFSRQADAAAAPSPRPEPPVAAPTDSTRLRESASGPEPTDGHPGRPDEDDDEVEVDDRGDPVDRIQPKRPGEFVCQSCFLVKHPSQLADASRMFCSDCV